MPVILAILLPIIYGYFGVSLLMPDQHLGSNKFLKLLLAIGAGIGLSSCIFFISMLINLPDPRFSIILEVLLAISLGLIYFLKFNNRKKPANESIESKNTSFILKIVCFYLIAYTVISYLLMIIQGPHGNWDSWLIWNLHAKFLYKSGILWKDYFHSPLTWTHPDYPLLVPAFIARFWYVIKHSNPVIPMATGFIFMLLTVLLLYAGLNQCKDKKHSYIGVIILLSTPFFLLTATTLCADTPISFYFLAAIIALFLYDKHSQENKSLLALAGVMSGLAAWTKNEGVLFAASIVAARCLVLIFSKDFKVLVNELKYIFFGLLPFIILILYFKLFIALPNDMLSGQNFASIVQKITDPSRIKTVYEYYKTGGWVFTMGLINPFILAGGCMFVGINIKKEYKTALKCSLLTIIIMLVAYFIIYLITPHNLVWHLANSLNRIFIQLWAVFIFICLMAI